MRRASQPNGRSARPPRVLRVLVLLVLRLFLPASERAAVGVELDELHDARRRAAGPVRAAVWYALQLPSFGLRLSLVLARRASRRVRGAGSAEFRRRRSSGSSSRGRHEGWLLQLPSGLAQAGRALRRSPAYALATVLTLGLGIAGVSAVYGVANWVLLRPVPGVRAPDQLLTIVLESFKYANSAFPIAHTELQDLRSFSPVLSGMAAAGEQDVHVAPVAAGSPVRLPGQVVTANYFDVLGIAMAAGRGFLPGDDGEGAPAVAVVGQNLARRFWGDVVSAVGAEVRVNGLPYTVVGVAPRGFHGDELPGRVDIWFPAGALPGLLHEPGILRGASQVWSRMILRPGTGAPVAGIAAQLNRALSASRAQHAGAPGSVADSQAQFRAHRGIGLSPLLRSSVQRTLTILTAAAVLLLLLACANVANLGLARAAVLRASVTLRLALGAGHARLVLERLMESALAGIAGSGLGALLALLAVTVLRHSNLGLLGVPLDGVALDLRVLAFTIAAGLMAGVLAGVLPSLAVRHDHASRVLRSARHGDRRGARVRSALVMAQVALSAILLVGAGLLATTLWQLRRVEIGVPVDGVVTFAFDPELQGYDAARTVDLVAKLLDAVRADPAVSSAGISGFPPFGSLYIPLGLKRPEGDWRKNRVVARSFSVSPGFMDALGVRLVAGRPIPEDLWLQRDSTAPRVAILNETAARALFPELQPVEVVGKSVDMRGPGYPPLQVIGVVRDARLANVSEPPIPYCFQPWSQGFVSGTVTVYARTRGDPRPFLRAVREIMARVDGTLPVYELRTLRELIDDQLAEPRFVSLLAVVLAALGLVLAAVGLYGLLAHSVAERTREIGIRSALGAVPSRIVRQVVRGGLGTTLAGAAAGLLGAAFLGRYLESRLFGVEPLDPSIYLAGIVLLLGVALLASWLPARRAMRVDPMVALRSE